MQTTLALIALAAVAYAAPQVTGDIAPSAAIPAGCSSSYSGEFQITAVNTTIAKRGLQERAACGSEGTLTISLAGGQLKDAKGRTGYIASNYQFQFDEPPQTGSIYTGGFSVCSNGSLALGGSAVFYECLSGSFYNLYDRSWAAQCEPILIDILPCSSGTTTPAAGQASDGQPTGTAVATAVSQITDGQPQAASAIAISEFTDGQPQVPTALPVAITQISDGQIQATTAGAVAPISQISDGQIQATSLATVVKSTAVAISQISDGQVQATAAPVKASTVSGAPISQITDGQIQAGNATAVVSASVTPSSAPLAASGAGMLRVGSQCVAAFVAIVAVALL